MSCEVPIMKYSSTKFCAIPAARAMRVSRSLIASVAWFSCFMSFAVTFSWAQKTTKLSVQWDNVTVVSRSTPTFQVVVNPKLRPGDPLSTASYAAMKDLGADYVRFVPWLPYPKLAVAELDPPTKDKTSWNFELIDPLVKDFMAAADGHPTVMNFSTIPTWLFRTDKPVPYPADPNEVTWNYTQGTELMDPSMKQLGDYYARLVSWYTQGGFTDENGKRHESGYHYKFPVWEVLNETDAEHKMTPKQYTDRYDAIVAAIHKVSPETKFMGLAVSNPGRRPDFFDYFLDPKNHKPGTPIEYISYHFYAGPEPEETLDHWQYTLFDETAGFITNVRYIETLRKRLMPGVKSDLNELGVILPTDNKPGDDVAPVDAYWNLCGAQYAYLFIELSKQQIELIGMSQLIGYPTQYPGVSMMDWRTNQPNARFWTLKLLKDSFHPGDKLVATDSCTDDVAAQGYLTPRGRKLLLANKRNRAIDVEVAGSATAAMLTVDGKTGDSPARRVKPEGGKVHLEPFAVAVVSW
jgi:hypothetical protein